GSLRYAPFPALATEKEATRRPGSTFDPGSEPVDFCSAPEELHERLFVRDADVLPGLLAAFEDDERGNAPNAVLARGLGRVVDVELRDLVFPGELFGDLVHDRRDHLAGAAPRGREVDEDGHVRLQDLLLEVRVTELDDVLAGHGVSWFPEVSTVTMRCW